MLYGKCNSGCSCNHKKSFFNKGCNFYYINDTINDLFIVYTCFYIEIHTLLNCYMTHCYYYINIICLIVTKNVYSAFKITSTSKLIFMEDKNIIVLGYCDICNRDTIQKKHMLQIGIFSYTYYTLKVSFHLRLAEKRYKETNVSMEQLPFGNIWQHFWHIVSFAVLPTALYCYRQVTMECGVLLPFFSFKRSKVISIWFLLLRLWNLKIFLDR